VFVHALLAYLTRDASSVVPVFGIAAAGPLGVPSRKEQVRCDAGPGVR
jgi:hypothetical protein